MEIEVRIDVVVGGESRTFTATASADEGAFRVADGLVGALRNEASDYLSSQRHEQRRSLWPRVAGGVA